MARTKFSELRDQVVAKPGAAERLAKLREGTLDEIRLYEVRHGEGPDHPLTSFLIRSVLSVSSVVPTLLNHG